MTKRKTKTPDEEAELTGVAANIAKILDARFGEAQTNYILDRFGTPKVPDIAPEDSEDVSVAANGSEPEEE